MKNLKKLSRKELKEVNGGNTSLLMPIEGGSCSADSTCASGCRGLASNGDRVCSNCCIA